MRSIIIDGLAYTDVELGRPWTRGIGSTARTIYDCRQRAIGEVHSAKDANLIVFAVNKYVEDAELRARDGTDDDELRLW